MADTVQPSSDIELVHQAVRQLLAANGSDPEVADNGQLVYHVGNPNEVLVEKTGLPQRRVERALSTLTSQGHTGRIQMGPKPHIYTIETGPQPEPPAEEQLSLPAETEKPAWLTEFHGAVDETVRILTSIAVETEKIWREGEAVKANEARLKTELGQATAEWNTALQEASSAEAQLEQVIRTLGGLDDDILRKLIKSAQEKRES